jgi:hypothetical protein
MKTDFKKLEKKYANASDDENPIYLFNSTWNTILIEIAKGKINPVHLAMRELACRGLDINGTWIGFDKAEKYWNEKMQ